MKGQRMCDNCGLLKPEDDFKPVIFGYEDCEEAGWMCAGCWAYFRSFTPDKYHGVPS